MTTIKTRNGWTITGEVTARSRYQVTVRVTRVMFNGLDCTATATPNMCINVMDIKSETE